MALPLWLMLTLLSLSASSVHSKDDFGLLLKRCCKLGMDYADHWPRLTCTTNDVTMLPSFNFSEMWTDECENTFRLCCASQHRTKNCDLGRKIQRSGEQCSPNLAFTAFGRYSDHSSAVYECCQACKLGSRAREEGQSCSLSYDLSLSDPWSVTFQECCSNSNSSERSSNKVTPLVRDLETDSSADKPTCENGYLDSAERCRCNQGYRTDGSGQSCVDVDECVESRRSPCASWQECHNTQGSFNCINKPAESIRPPSSSSDSDCPQGLTKGDYGNCIDVDECVLEPPVCHPTLEVCVNVLGSYRCDPRVQLSNPSQCSDGFRSIDGKCYDIDECSIGMHRCRPSIEDCINTHGSYECKPKIERLTDCDLGFTHNPVSGICEDENECSDLYRCPDTHTCINTPGSFLCIRRVTCGTGYEYNATSDKCEDINECETSPNICGSPAMFECVNTPGTYRCQRISCPSGQTLQYDGTCRSIQCPTGFERNEYGKCEDIDECASSSSICPPDHACVNLVGTFQCRSICETGLRYDRRMNQCIDIDECAERTHNCKPDQTCTNAYRSFSCSCPPGHMTDQYHRCVDIDECAKYGSDICPTNSLCVNNVGNFDCICKKGYRQAQYTRDCVDIDECVETPWVCPHKCINTEGSFTCACPPGFRLGDDGRTCVDVDECSVINNRTGLSIFCEGNCTNTEGSYECSCPTGFQVRNNRYCDDINECEKERPCTEAICLNSIGSYKCFKQDCPEGYIRDAAHTHRCKRPRKSTQCFGDQCYDIYKEPLSYSYSYISLPSDVPIPTGSGRLSIFTARGPLLPNSEVLFTLNVTSVEIDDGVEPATRDDFHLNSAYNEAIISLVKPLKGEQLVKLELDLELFQGSLPSGKTKIILMLHISKHSLRKSLV